MTVTGSDELKVDVADGVAALTLNRPQARNALNPSMRDTLIAAVRECRGDDDVRAVLITGADGVFCSGADLAGSSLGKVTEPDFDPRSMSHQLQVGANALITELWTLDKPTVACVDGAAVGPGAHLALACDFVLVSPTTKFLWSFSKLGLVVDGGGAYLLPRLVGLPRAKAMVMLGEGCVGEQAVTDGLAYRCVAAGDVVRRGARAGASARRRSDPRARHVEAAAQRVVRVAARVVAAAGGRRAGARVDDRGREGRADGGPGEARPGVSRPVSERPSGGPPFYDVLTHQRACRSFLPDPVPDDVIDRILTAATYAPSAENSQPWRFIVVKDAERLPRRG